MKIKKQKETSQKFFELQLIYSKLYKRFSQRNITISEIEMKLVETLVTFKKALQLVFRYHKHQRHIWFVGVSQNFQNELLKITKQHTIVPKSINLRSLIINETLTKSVVKNSSKEILNSRALFKPEMRPDLVVLFDDGENTQILVEKIVSAKIPLILLQNFQTNHIMSYNSLYQIKSDNQKLFIDNLFLILMNAALKRSDRN